MRSQLATCGLGALILSTALTAHAQPPPLSPSPPASASQAPSPEFDPAAVERGRQALVTECGFCHGPTARGGSSGPDLTRSEVVLNDDNGRQLGEFLRVGR